MSVELQLDITNLLNDIQKIQTQIIITNSIRSVIQQKNQDFPQVHSHLKFQSDLGFALIDIIHLLTTIERKFQKNLHFAQLLIKDGKYVEDLTVDDLVVFVTNQLETT